MVPYKSLLPYRLAHKYTVLHDYQIKPSNPGQQEGLLTHVEAVKTNEWAEKRVKKMTQSFDPPRVRRSLEAPTGLLHYGGQVVFCLYVCVQPVCIYMRQTAFVWVVGSPGREELSVWEVAIKTQSRDIWGGLMTLHGSVFGGCGWGVHIYTVHTHKYKYTYLTGFIVELGDSLGFWCLVLRPDHFVSSS